MNAHFLGFECQIQFVPSATRPIEPRCGMLAALFRQSQRLHIVAKHRVQRRGAVFVDEHAFLSRSD